MSKELEKMKQRDVSQPVENLKQEEVAQPEIDETSDSKLDSSSLPTTEVEEPGTS